MAVYPSQADDPLVSVLVPSFNRLPLLRRAVAAVQAQTLPSWELVVADDGSSDGTLEWLREAAAADPRIRWVAEAHTGNIARVRNRAAAAARGAWFAILDSDDLWLPRKLELQLAALRSDPAARWSFNHFVLLTDEGLPVPFLPRAGWPESGWILEGMLRREIRIATSSVMMERSLYAELKGFDEALPRAEDFNLWLRAAATARCVVVGEMLTEMRLHAEQTTAIAPRGQIKAWMLRALDRFMRTQSSPEIRRLCRRLKARFAFDLATVHYKQRRPLGVLANLARSLWWAPSGAGGRLWLNEVGSQRIRAKLRGRG
jgi:glycosyltransferase involved in cell wall biosynthesis